MINSVWPSHGSDLRILIQCSTTMDAEFPTLHISFFLKKILKNSLQRFLQNRQLSARPLGLLLK
jgi:hypothetical protein